MSTVGKTIKCKAAVVWAAKQKMSIEDVEVAPPKAGEVRIKMVATGVCHSDVFIQEGRDHRYVFPAVLGHEGCGIVESVGPGVTSVKPGDHVVPVFTPQCRKCKLCKDPRTNHCEDMKSPMAGLQKDGTARITCKGQEIRQMASISTFSEYTVTSEEHVAKVNPKANLKKIPLAGCCIPTGYGAVNKTAKMPADSICVVFGLGGVGMAVALGCKASGAKRVIGVDVNPEKFEIGKQFGFTEFVNPKDHDKPIEEVLAGMTNGGADYTYVAVGNLHVMEQGIKATHPAYGTAVMVGLADVGQRLSVDPWELLYGKRLIGTFYGGYKPRDEIPPLVDLYVEGKLPMDKLISHTLPLERINEAIDMMLKGVSLRSVIEYK